MIPRASHVPTNLTTHSLLLLLLVPSGEFLVETGAPPATRLDIVVLTTVLIRTTLRKIITRSGNTLQ